MTICLPEWTAGARLATLRQGPSPCQALRIWLLWIAVAIIGASGLRAQQADIRDIADRAFKAAERNDKLRRNYTYKQLVEERKLNKHGEVEDTDSETFEVMILYGEEYERLIARNGEPLTPKQEARQQRKVDKAVEKLANENPEQREKRLAKRREEEEEFRKVLEEFINGYDFRLLGEEEVGGSPCYVIEAEPKPGYVPRLKKARFIGKIRGKMWIAKSDFGLVRTEAETIEDVSFGLFLFKLQEGASIEFDQSLVNSEVWLLDRFIARGSAKVFLVAPLRREYIVNWSDFRKFDVESKLVAGSQ